MIVLSGVIRGKATIGVAPRRRRRRAPWGKRPLLANPVDRAYPNPREMGLRIAKRRFPFKAAGGFSAMHFDPCTEKVAPLSRATMNFFRAMYTNQDLSDPQYMKIFNYK